MKNNVIESTDRVIATVVNAQIRAPAPVTTIPTKPDQTPGRPPVHALPRKQVVLFPHALRQGVFDTRLPLRVVLL